MATLQKQPGTGSSTGLILSYGKVKITIAPDAPGYMKTVSFTSCGLRLTGGPLAPSIPGLPGSPGGPGGPGGPRAPGSPC